MQDGIKCLKDTYIKNCGVEYYNVFVAVQESLVYPTNRNCKLERAATDSIGVGGSEGKNNAYVAEQRVSALVALLFASLIM